MWHKYFSVVKPSKRKHPWVDTTTIGRNFCLRFQFKWREMRWRRERASHPMRYCHLSSPWEVREPYGAERWHSHEAHALLTGRWPTIAFGHSPPSYSSCVLRPFSCLRTPNLNPFSDYELWLPHAQGRLWNFDKRLRIWLGIQWRRQHNVWEHKVA